MCYIELYSNNIYHLHLLQLIFSQKTKIPLFYSGGDDVHQLCEAGEAEFLEIMALVGMASKPLHVRRLQKALQEWVQNPGRIKLDDDLGTRILNQNFMGLSIRFTY